MKYGWNKLTSTCQPQKYPRPLLSTTLLIRIFVQSHLHQSRRLSLRVSLCLALRLEAAVQALALCLCLCLVCCALNHLLLSKAPAITGSIDKRRLTKRASRFCG